MAAALALLLAACRVFEFTPYEVPEAARGESMATTGANLERLAALPKASGRSFRFAVMADSHNKLDLLDRAVASLNADSSLRFVLMAGDFTQYGLLQEYQWFQKAMGRLKHPWLTVIGNHDALANGKEIYNRLFGPMDYAFTYEGVRFVCVNTNFWEFETPVPDWGWMEKEFMAASGSGRIFTVSHIAPFGDQFDESGRLRWTALLARYRVELSIHGHQHNFRYEESFSDGVQYLVADDVGDRNYLRVTVEAEGVQVDRIAF